jgi:hypothetical protein
MPELSFAADLDAAAAAFLSDFSDLPERPLAIVEILLVAGRKSGP